MEPLGDTVVRRGIKESLPPPDDSTSTCSSKLVEGLTTSQLVPSFSSPEQILHTSELEQDFYTLELTPTSSIDSIQLSAQSRLLSAQEIQHEPHEKNPATVSSRSTSTSLTLDKENLNFSFDTSSKKGRKESGALNRSHRRRHSIHTIVKDLNIAGMTPFKHFQKGPPSKIEISSPTVDLTSGPLNESMAKLRDRTDLVPIVPCESDRIRAEQTSEPDPPSSTSRSSLLTSNFFRRGNLQHSPSTPTIGAPIQRRSFAPSTSLPRSRSTVSLISSVSSSSLARSFKHTGTRLKKSEPESDLDIEFEQQPLPQRQIDNAVEANLLDEHLQYRIGAAKSVPFRGGRRAPDLYDIDAALQSDPEPSDNDEKPGSWMEQQSETTSADGRSDSLPEKRYKVVPREPKRPSTDFAHILADLDSAHDGETETPTLRLHFKSRYDSTLGRFKRAPVLNDPEGRSSVLDRRTEQQPANEEDEESGAGIREPDDMKERRKKIRLYHKQLRHRDAPRRQGAPHHQEVPRQEEAFCLQEVPRHQEAPCHQEVSHHKEVIRHQEVPRHQEAPHHKEVIRHKKETLREEAPGREETHSCKEVLCRQEGPRRNEALPRKVVSRISTTDRSFAATPSTDRIKFTSLKKQQFVKAEKVPLRKLFKSLAADPAALVGTAMGAYRPQGAQFGMMQGLRPMILFAGKSKLVNILPRGSSRAKITDVPATSRAMVKATCEDEVTEEWPEEDDEEILSSKDAEETDEEADIWSLIGKEEAEKEKAVADQAKKEGEEKKLNLLGQREADEDYQEYVHRPHHLSTIQERSSLDFEYRY